MDSSKIYYRIWDILCGLIFMFQLPFLVKLVADTWALLKAAGVAALLVQFTAVILSQVFSNAGAVTYFWICVVTLAQILSFL